MSGNPVAHPLSQAIYEGVLEKPPWKTLLKYLEDYMQVPSATLYCAGLDCPIRGLRCICTQIQIQAR